MEVVKQCEYCGKTFTATNGMQKYCNNTHFKKCVVCGKEFEISNSQLNSKESKQCCSRKCSAELRKRTNVEKYGGVSPASSSEIQAKMKATTLERFGVEHAMQNDEVKKKVRDTNMQKYGVSCYLQTQDPKDKLAALHADPDFKSKVRKSIEETTFKRYGVRCLFEDPEFRERAAQTRLEKTGYRYTWEDPKLLQKSQETMKKKYGVAYPLQSEELKAKCSCTNIERYGVPNVMQNASVKEKAARTNIERYGVKNAGQSDEFQAKRKKTMEERYGASVMMLTKESLIERMSDPSKADNLIEFHENPELYIQSHFETQPSMSELAANIGIRSSTLGQYLSEHNMRDAVKYVRSEMEQEVYEFLQSKFENINIVLDDRQVIAPLEIDIYLPDFKIGIECNPTATHNSTTDPWNAGPKDYKYHQRKTDEAEKKGVFLFHLFGNEWTHKRKIIESMLCNLIQRNESTIYARKCNIIEVDGTTAAQFLNDNHRQGNTNSAIRLGLTYNNELVSLMTFGKMRSTIGKGNENLDNCYELVRFCSRLNTSVVGGASRLFKEFLRQYDPKQVRSFSDRAHTSGQLYSLLGFTEIRRSDPGYVWVDVRTDKAYHRVNAQKQNIKEFLKDNTIDLTKTEAEIMTSHGFVQVFDSGTITWEWAKLEQSIVKE